MELFGISGLIYTQRHTQTCACKTNEVLSWALWLIPVILATWEAEIGRIAV
jgi:hypothetical protein